MPDSKTLLFVYNIDSRVLQSLHDYSAGRAVASGQISCSLMAMTHSPVGMKKEWKRFLKELVIPSRSLDKNEFIAEFGARQITYPAILVKKGGDLILLITTEDIARCRDLGELISLVLDRLLSADPA